MKSRSEVQRRLKKLNYRYAKRYMDNSQKRIHTNCVHNFSQAPLNKPVYNIVEESISPRCVSTYIYIGDDMAVNYCMHGSDSGVWPGVVCDSDDVSNKCKWFSPRVSSAEAEKHHDELMLDDKYVYNNYPDVAALQWVISGRIGSDKSWYFRLVAIFTYIYRRFVNMVCRKKDPSKLGPEHEILEEGLWLDDSTKDPRA